MRKNVIVGTAGHIDHGKTSLVQALTGVNTDRWEEERRRGITIDLGFAHLDLDDDLRLGFIDVPGHERFVRNMLAGAGGVDVAMLVVAADESVMPQTREHFDICRLLGIRTGLVALTKTDRVDEEIVELVRLEVAELAAGSFLEQAPIVPVSAKTGAGLDALRETLADVARRARAKDAGRRFRLPVDRVFVSKGFGAVVTGTLVAGAVSVDDEVEVFPSGKSARVRGLQGHGDSLTTATAGSRTAVNLSGIDAAALARGMVLAEPGVFRAADRINVQLDLLQSAPKLKHASPVHFHLGAAEVEAKVYWRGRDPQTGARPKSRPPGSRTFAQIRLAEPVLALPGDRFVIRRFSPVVTIGGGVVLDNQAPQREPEDRLIHRLEALASEDPRRTIEALAAERAEGVGTDEVARRTGWTPAEIESAASDAAVEALPGQPPRYAHRERLAEAEAELLDSLRDFHKRNPMTPGRPRGEMPSAVLERLAAQGKVVLEGELARLAEHRVTLQKDEQEAREKLLAAFRAAGLAVPRLNEFMPTLPVDPARARRILANLLREGELVRVTDELVFHTQPLAELDRKLVERKAAEPTISVPQFKDLAGVSRKYAIPLLEYFDRIKRTRRRGDAREIL